MSLLFAKRGRRMAALGAVGIGACAVLAACSPVKMGSAAIVGNQRITVSTVDTQVANLKAAAKPYGSAIQMPSAQMPKAVLNWLVSFAIMDETAAANGISVTQAQATAGLSSFESLAPRYGFSEGKELLVALGIPPQLFPQAGRWWAEQTAYEVKANGGKQPSSQAELTKLNKVLSQANCRTAKTLNIQVSPQFGRFDYSVSNLGVVPAADQLSRPAGTPSPANTQGLTPAC